MVKVVPESPKQPSAPHGGIRIPKAHLIGGSKVPSFALFGFVALQTGDALRATNAKGGSCVDDAASRVSLRVVEAAKRS
jgi:hypothetical protein